MASTLLLPTQWVVLFASLTVASVTSPSSPGLSHPHRAQSPRFMVKQRAANFAASDDSKIKCFDVSTGSQLAESQILSDGDGNVKSIALATNGSFIATYSGRTIFFLDASTLTRIDPIINESEDIASITLSPDSNYLATGRRDGKISVHNLGHILLDMHDPRQVSICPFIMSAYWMCPILSPTLTYSLRHLVASNDHETSPAAKPAMVISSRYPFVLFTIESSSHSHIVECAVECSRSRVRL